jgi:hypothetical protein
VFGRLGQAPMLDDGNEHLKLVHGKHRLPPYFFMEVDKNIRERSGLTVLYSRSW